MDSQELRSEEKLLNGKVFISTRPAGKSGELKMILQQYGSELLELPLIDIEPARLSPAENDLLLNIGRFDWIVFTSANGITHFFEHLKSLAGSYTLKDHTRIAVVGRKTADVLTNYGHTAHYINKGSTGEDLSLELSVIFGENHPKVLLPVGNLAREDMEDNLSLKAELVRINVYNTVMPKDVNPEILNRIVEGNYEMIVFTSPSGFHNLLTLIKGKMNIKELKIASIGSTTSKAILKEGIHPLVTAKMMNSQGIVDEIVKSLSLNPSPGEREANTA